METQSRLGINYDRLEKIMKTIHIRIEQKYRDYRAAFQSIDKDFNGKLAFKEFMMTLEDIGIKLRLNDFKLIFSSLDYDSKGVVDFEKFCHVNVDRYSLIDLLKKVSFHASHLVRSKTT